MNKKKSCSEKKKNLFFVTPPSNCDKLIQINWQSLEGQKPAGVKMSAEV